LVKNIPESTTAADTTLIVSHLPFNGDCPSLYFKNLSPPCEPRFLIITPSSWYPPSPILDTKTRKFDSTREHQEGKQPWSTPPRTPRRSEARYLCVYMLFTGRFPRPTDRLWRSLAGSDALGGGHSEGNEFFKRQDYANAIKKYSEAIELDGNNHVYYSNRRCDSPPFLGAGMCRGYSRVTPGVIHRKQRGVRRLGEVRGGGGGRGQVHPDQARLCQG